MEDKIQHIDHDLKMTRRDLHSLREEVRKKEEMWSREKAQLELERKLSREQLTVISRFVFFLSIFVASVYCVY